MILVLGATVVLLTAAAAIARVRVSNTLRARSSDSLILAWEVAHASEAPILAWLTNESSDVVLPLDAEFPMIEITDARLSVADVPVSLTITAWDQHGMVPNDAGLVDVLPARVADRLDEAPWIEEAHPGLDQGNHGPSVFPSRDHPGALGGIIATHSPSPGSARGRAGRGAVVNVNTAPVWLLESLLSDSDGFSISDMLADRAAGDPVSYSGRGEILSDRIRFIGTSTAWSFRIDVETSHARVSIWSVYTRRGGVWNREQQLVIAD